MKPTMPHCSHVCAAFFILAAACSGCATMEEFDWGRRHFPVASPASPVVRILCIWEPAQGQGLDGAPARGFAGQILFFTANDSSPAEVDGDVRIYVFDDQGTPEEQARPMHQFDFNAAAWKVHLRHSSLGPAYQVFIPYTRKGYRQARCALRLRLKPVDHPAGGACQPVYSDMAHIVLPGKTDDADGESALQSAGAPLAEQLPNAIRSAQFAAPVPTAGAPGGVVHALAERAAAPTSPFGHAAPHPLAAGAHPLGSPAAPNQAALPAANVHVGHPAGTGTPPRAFQSYGIPLPR